MRTDHSSRQRSEPDACQIARQHLSPEEFGRLFWLSGSTCAGKTTVSSAVAERLNFNVYHCDEHEQAQGQRADPARHPNWLSYSRLTGDALWLRPVEQQVADQERASYEQFELIVEDLAKMLNEDRRPLIYDGYVSPSILAPLLPSGAHAFYLVCSDSFQREYYQRRPWIKDVLAKTSAPEIAWENWMLRDSLGASALEAELGERDMDWLQVDGSVSLEETVNLVATRFAHRQS